MKIIYNVFKIIVASMLLVVVSNTLFYTQRRIALDNQVEALIVIMRDDIRRNNYLSEDSFNLYTSMLTDLQTQLNGGSYNDIQFIRGFKINYGTESPVTTPSDPNLTYIKDLAIRGNTGDMQVIGIEIEVSALVWVFVSDVPGVERIAETFAIEPVSYTRLVPCQGYVKITN